MRVYQAMNDAHGDTANYHNVPTIKLDCLYDYGCDIRATIVKCSSLKNENYNSLMVKVHCALHSYLLLYTPFHRNEHKNGNSQNCILRYLY